MKNEKCNEINRDCEVCQERVAACFDHDEYFVCQKCGCRMRIDKEEMSRRYNLIFKTIFGKKPSKPENN